MLKLQFHYLAPLTAIAVLVMMQGWKATLPDASVGVPFRARVKEAIAQFPLQAGPWEGVNIPLPQEAVALLHPSAYLSRQYTEVTSGDRVAFLVIEAEDARDMMGHYPPNCYPAFGDTLSYQQHRTWFVNVPDDPKSKPMCIRKLG